MCVVVVGIKGATARAHATHICPRKAHITHNARKRTKQERDGCEISKSYPWLKPSRPMADADKTVLALTDAL
jgi:hypothetical protein